MDHEVDEAAMAAQMGFSSFGKQPNTRKHPVSPSTTSDRKFKACGILSCYDP